VECVGQHLHSIQDTLLQKLQIRPPFKKRCNVRFSYLFHFCAPYSNSNPPQSKPRYRPRIR
jgi:hypothetical protein